MTLTSPTPYNAALRYIRQQGLMPTTADSRRLEELHADITERAFFSSQVDRADILQRAKDLAERSVNPAADGPGQKIGKAAFRREMRNLLKEIGYEVDPNGDLKDITSTKRLNLIASMNTQEAQGYGQFEQANKPAVLSAFPAQELFRLETRQQPRPWLDKWRAAGGTLYEGRMIAMKDDPIWTKPLSSGGFNRFGRAWPPFDFNSGMWVKPVSRAEAVRLGVCGKTDIPKRQKRTYNESAQQSCRPLSPELQKRLNSHFANRFRIDDSGTVHMLSVAEGFAKVRAGFDRAHANAEKVFIGRPGKDVIDVVEPKLGKLNNSPVVYAEAREIDHINEDHGLGSSDNTPLTDVDYDRLPALVQSSAVTLVPSTHPHPNEARRAMISVNDLYDVVFENKKGNLSVVTYYKTKKEKAREPNA